MAEPQAQQKNTPSTPRRKPREVTPNGYGVIHKGHLYNIMQDSDLGREYAKLETKEQRREFLITKGEKRRKIGFDTRRRAPDQTYGWTVIKNPGRIKETKLGLLYGSTTFFCQLGTNRLQTVPYF